jgi:6,7-dimethyl-8-ribityllumazine synthase
MGKNLNTVPNHFIEPKNSIQHNLDGSKLTIGIVTAEFNQAITKSLFMGAMQGLTEHGVLENNIISTWVPGAFEVPVVANKLFKKVDAVIAIACVIQGDTPHFDYVCNGITQGLNLAIQSNEKPGIFCVLTTNTVAQAEERAIPNAKSNKGYEAAITAIQTVNTLNAI